MLMQHALDDRPQVGCRREIAALIKMPRLQAGPVRNDAAAFDCATCEQRDGAGAMVRAAGTVDARGAAEFRRHDHPRIAPALTEAGLEFRKRTIETRQQK